MTNQANTSSYLNNHRGHLFSFVSSSNYRNIISMMNLTKIFQRSSSFSYSFDSRYHLNHPYSVEVLSMHDQSEDAYSHSSNYAVLCDGVGGWKKHGISPTLFSNELCDNILSLLSRYLKALSLKNKLRCYSDFSMSKASMDSLELSEAQVCKRILLKAAKKCREKGSSTCTMLLFNERTAQLSSAYIGDSNYLIARRGKGGRYEKLFKSVTQRYNQTTPYQISSEDIKEKMVLTETHQLIEDDIVLLASDGFWDNATDEKVIDLLNASQKDLSKRIYLAKKDDVTIIILRVVLSPEKEKMKSCCSSSTESNDKIDDL